MAIPEEPWLPLCPLLPPAAMPAVLPHRCASSPPARGQEADVHRGDGRLFPVSPGKGRASCSGASRLLLALCHSGREAMLKTSSAFLGFSTTLEGLSNSLEWTG